MADYKENIIAGKSWQRCNKIQINNPYIGDKTVTLFEEEITDLGNGKFLNEPKGSISVIFDNPAATVNLINPVTGDALGATTTYQDIYVILHSLYIQKALERDSQV